MPKCFPILAKSRTIRLRQRRHALPQPVHEVSQSRTYRPRSNSAFTCTVPPVIFMRRFQVE